MQNPTVCLFYGFSRNLTTLFASLFALHPTSAEFKKTYVTLVGKYLGSSPEIGKFLAFAEQIPTVSATV